MAKIEYPNTLLPNILAQHATNISLSQAKQTIAFCLLCPQVLKKTLHLSNHTATTISLNCFSFTVSLGSLFCFLIRILASIFCQKHKRGGVAQAYESRNAMQFSKLQPYKSRNTLQFSNCRPTKVETQCIPQIVGLRKQKHNAILELQAYKSRNTMHFSNCRPTKVKTQCVSQIVGLRKKKHNVFRPSQGYAKSQ